MKSIIAFVLALQVGAVTGVSAETVSVPLPMIQGRYYVDINPPVTLHYHRQEHFELARVPLSVSGAWLHVSGTFVAGETSCWLYDPADQDTFAQKIELFASLNDTTGVWDPIADWMTGTESGPLEYTTPFLRASREVNWEFLKAGYGLVGMTVTFMIFPECSVLIWPEATIEQAELIIEGEFAVAVDQSTWGGIKALYR